MKRYHATLGGKSVIVGVDDAGLVTIDGWEEKALVRQTGKTDFLFQKGEKSIGVVAHGSGGHYSVLINGKIIHVAAESEREHRLRELAGTGGESAGMKEIRAPMPALVVSVHVVPGDNVVKGQGVMVLEAMKMENEIKAHQEGVVQEILVEKGEAVEKGVLLLRLM